MLRAASPAPYLHLRFPHNVGRSQPGFGAKLPTTAVSGDPISSSVHGGYGSIHTFTHGRCTCACRRPFRCWEDSSSVSPSQGDSHRVACLLCFFCLNIMSECFFYSPKRAQAFSSREWQSQVRRYAIGILSKRTLYVTCQKVEHGDLQQKISQCYCALVGTIIPLPRLPGPKTYCKISLTTTHVNIAHNNAFLIRPASCDKPPPISCDCTHRL